MKSLLIAGLLLATVLSGGLRMDRGSYIPITAGKQNVINFACGLGDSYSDLVGVTASGYTFSYKNLPSWVNVINGPMIAGIPSTTTPTAIQVFYTDANGKQGSQTVILAGAGTSSSATVDVPTATSSSASTSSSSSSSTTSTTSVSTGGRVTIGEVSSLQYVPGSTSSVSGSQSSSTTTTTATANSYGYGYDANLVTVVLPALAYPTPGRVSIVPPNAPTTGVRPIAPVSSPEEDAALVARQEAAMKGLANALDALNKANVNYNNLVVQSGNSQNDLNNALDYLQDTRSALRDAQNQQASGVQAISTVTTDISNLQTQIDSANNDINGLNANIADLQNNLNNAGPALGAAQKNLDDINAALASVTASIGDTQTAIESATTRITTLRQTIAETQVGLDNWPAAISKTKKDMANNEDRVEKARRELAEALAEQDELKAAWDRLQNVKVTGPKIIADANAQIDQITTVISGLNSKLKGLNDQLASLLNAKKTANDNIESIKNSIGDLGRKLAALRKALADRAGALNRYQAQLTQATQTLIKLKTNQKILDDNVVTLVEQLGLAEANVNNVRSTCEDIAHQIKNAENLINAAKVALERARTEKALSDQEINESIQRQGGTFPYPYVPGTGPYGIPGVTGNSAAGLSNPYSPGTVFGTGVGTTGRGASSGLPTNAAPGSPYNALNNPVVGVSGNRIVSASQSGNISPSALFPASSGKYFEGRAGYVAGAGEAAEHGAGGCFSNVAAGTSILSGSGRVVEIGDDYYALHNGYRVYTAPCTQGCKSKVGSSLKWSGFSKEGSFMATKLTCS